jgi:hypothetical protein
MEIPMVWIEDLGIGVGLMGDPFLGLRGDLGVFGVVMEEWSSSFIFEQFVLGAFMGEV